MKLGVYISVNFVNNAHFRKCVTLRHVALSYIGLCAGVTGSPNNRLVNALLMSVVGFFIGGPASLISAAISADLGKSSITCGVVNGVAQRYKHSFCGKNESSHTNKSKSVTIVPPLCGDYVVIKWYPTNPEIVL